MPDAYAAGGKRAGELDRETELDLAAVDAVADAAMVGEVMRDRLRAWRDAAGGEPNDGIWPCRAGLFDLTLDLGLVARRGACPVHDSSRSAS
jgi:hypothetical protein